MRQNLQIQKKLKMFQLLFLKQEGVGFQIRLDHLTFTRTFSFSSPTTHYSIKFVRSCV